MPLGLGCSPVTGCKVVVVVVVFGSQTFVLMLYSTLSRTQYDFTLPQATFTSSGYHKHITLTFNPSVSLRFLSILMLGSHDFPPKLGFGPTAQSA